jgi:2-polyprenyl-3-methyl-5-hydroxy-6-metoxy-1,4-benzoquinol methylase
MKISMMYQPNDLYQKYKERVLDGDFSAALPDVTNKTTLNHINYAINLCEHWDSVLDIGCGNGHYLAAVAAKFKKSVGVEIDVFPTQDILSQKYNNIKFFNGTIEMYQGHEYFDFVLLMDIFEHIPDVVAFMNKIGTLQKKGGIIYIVTPNPIFCGPASESELYYTKDGYHGHIKHYTKNEILDICKTAGYEPEFYVYEETKKRQTLRRIVKGLSRRDRRYSNMFVYRIVRPLVRFILGIVFMIIEKVCEKEEKRSEQLIFETRSLGIALKKF